MPRGATYKGVKVLGSINNLLYILPENKLDEIAITLSLENYDRLEELVDLCEKSGVHTKFIPDYNSLIPGRPYMEDWGQCRRTGNSDRFDGECDILQAVCRGVPCAGQTLFADVSVL